MTKTDIFSGFLGAGKTTLIKKLISEAFKGESLVIIENEFGDIGIDGGFLQDAGGNITEMNSGCVCCSLVGDFAAALKKVVDGDTLLVDFQGTSSYIRLIGINTPESVAPDEYLESTGKENTAEGSAASRYTKQVLIDKKYVYLEFDASEYDNYGRILAYVWIKPDKSNVRENMLNAKLLESGHAEVMSIEPNTRYKEEFEEIQCQALTMGE